MSKGGKIPVFAVYSSFLQRAYDQLIHDAAIDKAHIILAIDRAGFVGEDGETHQGLFDVPMLMTIPNTTIYSPSTYTELEMCLEKSVYNDEGIVAVRYPKGTDISSFDNYNTTSFHILKNNSKKLAIAYGRIIHNLYSNNSCDILKLVKIHPIENEIIAVCMNYEEILFFEEGSKSGGVGEKLLGMLYSNGYKGKMTITAVEGFVPQSSIERCMEKYSLDSNGMHKIINMSECVKSEN